MKRSLIGTTALAALVFSLCGITIAQTASNKTKGTLAEPQAFTAGNFVVCRVGDGTIGLSASAAPIFLDEYTLDGTLVSSTPLPVARSGPNYGITVPGIERTQCQITRSYNKRYIIVPGYLTALGGTPHSDSNPRTIARVDRDKAINITTGIRGFGTNHIRSAASLDGTSFWAVGAVAGTIYTPIGTDESSVQISDQRYDSHVIHIFDGQIYTSSNTSTNLRMGKVGTGLPSGPTQTTTLLSGVENNITPNGFFFADLSSDVEGSDTLYIADQNSPRGVRKYAFRIAAGTWVYLGTFPTSSNPSIPAAQFAGLAGSVAADGTVTLVATRSGTQLVKFVDANGYNVAPTAVPVLLATAAPDTAFRGVAPAPVNVVPTAANVSIAGRISDRSGRGIPNVRITLGGPEMAEAKRATSNAFGYYRIEDVPAGGTYFLSVSAKQFTFAEPVRVVSVNDTVTDADFVGDR